MNWVYKDRYGIPGEEIRNLATRYYVVVQYDSEFLNLDDFLQWVSESGYRKGLWLRRRDKNKPYSRENAYWHDTKAEKKCKKQKIQEDRAIVSPFCVQCQKESCQSNDLPGCPAWREYFIKNWNKNIRRKPPETPKEDPNIPKYFRYEHPDLVREGIVFENRSNNFPGSQ